MYSQLATTRIAVETRYVFRPDRAFNKNKANELTSETWPGQIYVLYKIAGVYHRVRFVTGIKTNRPAWLSSRTARPTADAKALLKELRALESLVDQLAQEMYVADKVITPYTLNASLRAFVYGDAATGVTLEKVYSEFLAWSKTRIEGSLESRNFESISESTYNTYPKRWAMVHDYLRTNKLLNFPIDNVDYPFAFRLKEWLQAQRQQNGNPYHPATVNKVISLLKQIMTYALSKGHTKQHGLHGFSCRGGSPANPKPLTEKMMDHLENCELPYSLRRFCDSWLVAAELCLHHADFLDLKNCRFIERGGRRYMQRKRRKQQGQSLMQTVDVTDRAERILAKYGGVAGLSYTSSQYFSRLLKQIAEKADLRDENGEIISLQFGMGRDTGLTLRAIDGANGVVLSKIAGWSKPAYAERYIGNPVDIIEAFADEKEKKRAAKKPVSTPPDEPVSAPQKTPVTGTPFYRVA